MLPRRRNLPGVLGDLSSVDYFRGSRGQDTVTVPLGCACGLSVNGESPSLWLVQLRAGTGKIGVS